MNEFGMQAKSFLNYCSNEKRLDDKTLRAYDCDLRQFGEWLKSYGKVLNVEGIREYVARLNEVFAARTVKRKIASLRAFARFCKDERFVPDNPFDYLHIQIREPKRLPRVIGSQDLMRIFDNRSGYNGFCGMRNMALVELLFSTGIRISEVCALDLVDLDFGARTLRIIGKGDRERVIQLESDETISALHPYLFARGELLEHREVSSNALFVSRQGCRLTDQSARNAVESYVRERGVASHVTPHMFRHTFATMLLEQDVDIRYIQHILGHSSITTTQIYTHVSSAKQREILRTKNPRKLVKG